MAFNFPASPALNDIYSAHGVSYRWNGYAWLMQGAAAYTDENAQDAIGAMVADTATIDLTYDDAIPAFFGVVKDGSLGTVKLGGDVTAAGKALLDDVDAAAQRVTLGLGNVDNTSDANKSISMATQAQLDGKVAKAGDTMTGDLTFEKAAATGFAQYATKITGGQYHWTVHFSTATTGDMVFYRMPDGGSFTPVLSLNRATGKATFHGNDVIINSGVLRLTDDAHYLWWDGSEYQFGGKGSAWNSGNFNPANKYDKSGGAIAGDVTVYRPASPTTGVIYMRSDQGAYWNYDGSSHVFVGGQIYISNNNLLVSGTSPQIRLWDTEWGSRYLHHDNSVIGFLKSDGSWDFYSNNNGQLWTPTYGWLHDCFAYRGSAATNNRWVWYTDFLCSPSGWNEVGTNLYVSGLYLNASYEVAYMRVRYLQVEVNGTWYNVNAVS